MSPTQALRSALKQRFYPFVLEQGFMRSKASSLFVPFERVSGNTIQFFDLQWDKGHRPRFVLNFGERPRSALSDLAQHPFAGRLQRRRGGSMGCWFQTGKPWAAKLRTFSWAYQPDEVAAHLITSFSELEAWWANKQQGPHVYVWTSSCNPPINHHGKT